MKERYQHITDDELQAEYQEQLDKKRGLNMSSYDNDTWEAIEQIKNELDIRFYNQN